MPYVNVPNDLSKIKTKIAFNLTKRQLICFGIGAAIGIPTYLLTRGAIGNTGALFVMLGIMLPAFLMAMYEKDGLPFEKVLRNIVGTRFMGTEEQHVKYHDAAGLDVIQWNKGEQAKTRKAPPKKFVGFPGLNVFRGETTVQFIAE